MYSSPIEKLTKYNINLFNNIHNIKVIKEPFPHIVIKNAASNEILIKNYMIRFQE